MDIDITRVKELIAKREEIDQELAALFAGTPKKVIRCGKCGNEGHTARTCPDKAIT